MTDFDFEVAHFSLPSSHRWRIQSGGERRETRRGLKHERAMRALSNGPMAGVYYVKLDARAVTLQSGHNSVLGLLLSLPFFPQHVSPPGERSVRCLQSSPPGRPQSPFHPTGHRSAGTGCVQD